MKIALVARPPKEAQLQLAVQLGVTDIVGALANVSIFPQPKQILWDYLPLLQLRQQVENAGLRLSVIETIPISNRITLGLDGRDEDLDIFCQSLENMGNAGIPILCYNFMAVFNWLRTSTSTRGRGNALVTSYDHELMANAPDAVAEKLSEEQMWENFEYFLRRVVPVAESVNVKLALHPDDPPISPIRTIPRIIRTVDALQRVIDMLPSDYNGITLCQGTIAAMGEPDIPNIIRHFGGQEKIFFAHFRDIRGSVPKFTETFHDNGKTDMVATIQAYQDIGFDGPIRPDHVPTLVDEANNDPGYEGMGRLFAVGYMRGLIDAIYGTNRGEN